MFCVRDDHVETRITREMWFARMKIICTRVSKVRPARTSHSTHQTKAGPNLTTNYRPSYGARHNLCAKLQYTRFSNILYFVTCFIKLSSARPIFLLPTRSSPDRSSSWCTANGNPRRPWWNEQREIGHYPALPRPGAQRGPARAPIDVKLDHTKI